MERLTIKGYEIMNFKPRASEKMHEYWRKRKESEKNSKKWGELC